MTISDTDLEKLIIDFRRDLHKIPELDTALPKTRAYLENALSKTGCELRDLGEAGFSAYFDANKPETIAFRADMDALPLAEETGLPYKSEHEDKMHACGHDGHMAILLGLATWAGEHKDKLNANVLLIFQGAEETTGGAKRICDSGVLSDYGAKRIYGLHLWPNEPLGAILCRKNEFMAGTFVVNVNFFGHAAHAAEFWNGADALAAAVHFYKSAYALEASLPENVFRLLRFCQLNAGSANNVVAENAHLEGTIRAFDDKTFATLKEGLSDIAKGIENDFNVRVELSYSEGYPPVMNPPELYESAKSVLTAAGFEWQELDEPRMQAEDYSYYQKEIPGLYFHLGTGVDATLHTPTYTLDERALFYGLKALRALLGA